MENRIAIWYKKVNSGYRGFMVHRYNKKEDFYIS